MTDHDLRHPRPSASRGRGRGTPLAAAALLLALAAGGWYAWQHTQAPHAVAPPAPTPAAPEPVGRRFFYARPGLREGDVLELPSPAGKPVTVRVDAITYQPESAGELHR